MLLESLELLNGSKEFNELCDSAAEEVELSEDLVGGEFELLTLWHVHKSLLGDLVLLLVSLVKLEAAFKDGDELIGRVLVVAPKDFVTDDSLAGLLSALSDSSEVQNVVLAVVDHLLSDLYEEASHTIVSIIVPGNGVNHLYAVHEGGKGILDGVRGSLIEWLDELLKSGEILNVILCLIEGLCYSQFNGSPLGGSKIDLISFSTAISLVAGGLSQDIVDSAAVFASELLRDAGELSHALAPVLDLVAGTSLLVFLTLGLSLFKSSLNLLRPVIEDALKVVEHFGVKVLGVLYVLDLVVVLAVILLQNNVALDTLQGILQL